MAYGAEFTFHGSMGLSAGQGQGQGLDNAPNGQYI